MKAAFLREPKRMVVEDIPKPFTGAGDILVKIAYCGICTLEQRLYTGERTLYYPIIPGHEASGIIEEIGEGVKTHHRVGDHVALDLVNRCHVCPACLSGNSNMCENRFKKGQRALGGFAEYILVRPDQAVVVPRELPLEQAAFSEPLACCIRSLKRVSPELGENILIIGAGSMGLMHLKAALLLGGRVIVSDLDEKRLEDARAMGADAVVDASNAGDMVSRIRALTENRGVDCCIVTSPAETALKAATDSVALNGRINIYTSYNDKPLLPLDMNSLHRAEALVTGSEGRTEREFFLAARLLSIGKIDVSDLVSGIYPLEEVSGAVEAALSASTYRILLRMEENAAPVL
ncbi:MAG: alcohol dehydrogenase catalytic domain-containing protein [Treponema sp.]|jgi:L-iditol 2-dehydrogenase|nr:alcohol dehydrogenase catalytic domain-containing protein [Treponema sp.]